MLYMRRPPAPDDDPLANNPPTDYSQNPADDYPPHLKHLAPTNEDLDMVREEVTGRPVDRGTALRNCAALEQRIAQLLRHKEKLLARYAEGHDVLHFITEADRDLAEARELLAACELQARSSN